MPARQKGPLAGVKVIELTHVMAGPVCGLMLADMGADVIKVERLPGGDSSREDLAYTVGGESAAFMMMNRNKRGIPVDLKSEGGREVLHRLLQGADVILENYRAGTMARLGFGYDDLHARYPRLIYCAVSGFGRTGPYAERGGFDLVAQGMSGLMSITGEGPGRPPVKCGAPVTDICAGILAAMGILAALHHRERSGEGQMVDTSLFEAGVILTYWQSAIAFAAKQASGPMGSAHPLSAPYEAFETADGWITLGAANQANWLRLLEVLDARHLAEDPRFADNAGRLENRLALAEALTGFFRTRPKAEWLERLHAAGVPAGPILDTLEMHQDPQVRARGLVAEVAHARAGPVETLGLPVTFTATPGGPMSGAPLYGEHTREILAEHGLSQAEIETLLSDGAVAAV
jgi:crotonobetainyl-CoA:carnitine CoA-transferase CaiB-like acyl-CoA transferase